MHRQQTDAGRHGTDHPTASTMDSTGTHVQTYATLDAHAGGEPLRLILSGVPELRGESILARRAEMLAEHDHIRRALMWEPRGHADMYGALLTPPVTPEADYGVLFMHNEGYSLMCGHGIIAVTTMLLETGRHPLPDGARDTAMIAYDAPAGLIRATATLADGRVTRVAFTNVPSFVYHPGVVVQLPWSTEPQAVPVVFGGAFYALLNAADAGLRVEPTQTAALIDAGMAVKQAVRAALDIRHPLDPGLTDLYGTIICGEPGEGADARNVTIFADGEVDRSPCGTGTAARLAWIHAQGQITVGTPWVHESITGSRFSARVLHETQVGPHAAIVPEIAGQAWITGEHTFRVAADDPQVGFLLR